MAQFAIVTGASKGIGRSIALQLAQQGYNLIIVSRSADDLALLTEEIREFNKVTVYQYACDLSDEPALNKFIVWVKELKLPLSILVNNAGFGLWGKFIDLSLDEQLQMVRLNIDAVISLSYQLLPSLQQQKKAYILNVASTAAYQSVPTLALYSATKAAILSFSRALRWELKGGPVSVTCLSPGPTDTGFAKRAGMDKLADLAEKFNMTADEVAEAGVKALLAGKAEFIPGFLNKLTAISTRFVSKNFVERIAAGMYDK